ncbi:hypothetical protein NPIL_495261 [Nephila pilipes]|uniref:Uncharacterized protein n=1 Tax=Nephila pilipes TaxID=299642 RepID=A0A8X6MDY5_NEPPI|nr:hypothetical protein NPIL_495261 [Nephila pilipes]
MSILTVCIIPSGKDMYFCSHPADCYKIARKFMLFKSQPFIEIYNRYTSREIRESISEALQIPSTQHRGFSLES